MNTDQRTLPEGQKPAVNHLLDTLSRLKFGTIQVTVHDSRIVEISTTTRSRPQ